MSRTTRRKLDTMFRYPRTQQTRSVEVAALDELLEYGERIRNRSKSRGNVSGDAIPTAYDDLNFSQYPKYKSQVK